MTADLEVICKMASLGLLYPVGGEGDIIVYLEAHFSDGSWKRWTFNAKTDDEVEVKANRFIRTREMALTARARAAAGLDPNG